MDEDKAKLIRAFRGMCAAFMIEHKLHPACMAKMMLDEVMVYTQILKEMDAVENANKN